MVKRSGKPVSEVCHRFEPLPQVLKNVRYKNGKPMESAAVLSAIASAEKKLGLGGRLIVRPSGTEPVIRVMGEGDDKVLVEAVVDDVVEALAEVAA
jgi:phosphoglucosamine mutase